MSDPIKVSEVTAMLRQQLADIDNEENTLGNETEVGTVLTVSDGVVRAYGLRNAEAGELLQFDNGMEAIVMNLEEDNVGAVLLGPTDNIEEGDIVLVTNRYESQICALECGASVVIICAGSTASKSILKRAEEIFDKIAHGEIAVESYAPDGEVDDSTLPVSSPAAAPATPERLLD